MSDTQLAVVMDGLAISKDQLAELTHEMTAGLDSYTKPQRLVMSNSGDFTLITSQGEQIQMGRQVDFVIIAQRPAVSRIHFASTYDPNSVESVSPDCYSTDGVEPDAGVTKRYSDKCANCPVKSDPSLPDCSYYRRLIVALVNYDGTLSSPCVFEPKALSLFENTVQTINNSTMMSYGAYMRALAGNMVNGRKMPIPVQVLVTRCTPMQGMKVPTMKFGIAPNKIGGLYLLDNALVQDIVARSKSNEIQELLRPFHPATENPLREGQIPVKQIEEKKELNVDWQKIGNSAPEPTPEPVQTPPPAPAKKAPPPPKSAPPAKKEPEMQVLGINHPCVKNSEDYDYQSIVDWAKDASAEEIESWLQENFPEALIPVPVEKPAPKTKKSPPKSAPPKAQAPTEVKQDTPIIEATAQVDDEVTDKDRAEAERLTQDLDDWGF